MVWFKEVWYGMVVYVVLGSWEYTTLILHIEDTVWYDMLWDGRRRAGGLVGRVLYEMTLHGGVRVGMVVNGMVEKNGSWYGMVWYEMVCCYEKYGAVEGEILWHGGV